RRITRRPDCARATARLQAVVVLPSPDSGLVTMMVLRGCRDDKYCTFVASVRYASLTGVLGASTTARCVSVSLRQPASLGITARVGASIRRSTSWRDLTRS